MPLTTNDQQSEVFEKSDFSSKSILFDESHCDNGSSLWAPGNASLFSWILDENGYESDTNFNENLDSGILARYDILVLFFPVVALTSGELSAVLSFVEDGGGLLLVGADASNWWEFRSTNLNSLSTTFGITFQSTTVTEIITTFSVHNITYGVSELHTEGDDIDACTLSVSAPAISIINSTKGSVVAISESGLGRIVCVGGPAPFYMYRKGASGYGNSHFQFSLNVIDWLARNPERLANIPEYATITVGPGPNLTTNEVTEYSMFVGAYHEHTTHSDGTGTPQEMLETVLERGTDFMVMTDHSYETYSSIGGITGALAIENIVRTYNLDISIIVGAELSAVKHTVGFPLTENIFTADQQEAVDEIHAQGAIAILAHPTISYTYASVYEALNGYGYDAVEVDNRGFFYGGGEDGFLYDFVGAGDTHSPSEVGTLLNAFFVENPSGPEGTITVEDIVDAILNKRVVIIDQYNDFIYGQEVWVEYYLNSVSEAEATIESSQSILDNLVDDGEDVSLSELYLEDAISAYQNCNPGRAIRMAQNATSDVLLGLGFEIHTTTILEPNANYESIVIVKNNNTFGIAINASTFVKIGIAFDSKKHLFEASSKSNSTTICSYKSNDYGLMLYSLNLYSFNTTEYINPLLIDVKGIIDNVSIIVDEQDNVFNIDVTYWMGRLSAKYIKSAVIVSNDGTGEQESKMDEGWNNYVSTLGPYPSGTELDIKVIVKTSLGETYIIGERVLTLESIISNTTSTSISTNTTTNHPLPLDTILIIAGIGGIVGIITLVILKFRK